MSEAVVRNVNESYIGLQPCEPSWLYSICNTFTLNSLLLHHRLHNNPAARDSLEFVMKSYESEFLNPDGHYIVYREKRGPAMVTAPSVLTDGYLVGFGNAAMPNTVQRAWLLLRNKMVDKGLPKLKWPDKVDLGNYKRHSGFSRIAFQVAAREMGDYKIAREIEGCFMEEEQSQHEPGAPLQS